MPSEQTFSRINDVVPREVTHVGFVLRDLEGSIPISLPMNPKHGVTANLPRVKLLSGETPARAVIRCISEVIGCPAVSAFPINGVFATSNSKTFYFAGFTQERQPEVATGIYWHMPDRARIALEQVKYAPTRDRNLAVLERACTMCLSPYRRVLEMVSELHRMGYERLRAPAYKYPLAWRCPVVPATWTLKEHGGLFQEQDFYSNDLLPERLTTYSSANGQNSLFPEFPARNIEFAAPSDLADEFIRLRPRSAGAGWGPDPAYVEWFQTTLATLAPHGVYYAFAEFQEPRDSLYTEDCRTKTVRLPPPGYSTKREWEAFSERHKDTSGD